MLLLFIPSIVRSYITVARQSQCMPFWPPFPMAGKWFEGGLGQGTLPQGLLGAGYVPPQKMPCRWRGKRLHRGGDACALLVFCRSQKAFRAGFFCRRRKGLGGEAILSIENNGRAPHRTIRKELTLHLQQEWHSFCEQNVIILGCEYYESGNNWHRSS